MKRINTPSAGESPSSKRKRLTINQKREVIHMLKNGSTVSYVAGHFSIGLQTVRDIKKNESSLDRYEIAYSGSSSLLRSLMRSNEFTSSDSLYFASLIDRLKRRLQRTVKQTSITRFFRRATD